MTEKDKKIAINVLGILGAVILSLLLIPQIITTIKTKYTDGISGVFLLLETLLSINFIIYGVLIDDIYIMLANSLAGVASIILIYLKIIYSNNSNENNNSTDNESKNLENK